MPAQEPEDRIKKAASTLADLIIFMDSISQTRPMTGTENIIYLNIKAAIKELK